MNHLCLVPLSEHQSVSTNPLGLGMLFEVTHRSIESTGKIDVVAVNEGKDVARHLFQALIDRMNLAPILFAHPIGQVFLVPTNNRSALVRTPTVNDDVFKILVALIQ